MLLSHPMTKAASETITAPEYYVHPYELYSPPVSKTCNSVVYLAKHCEKDYAFKVFDSSCSSLYERGVQALKRLSFCEHVVHLTDHFAMTSPKEKFTAIVTDFVNGITLETYVKKHKGHPMDKDDIFSICESLLEALIEIHSSGVVHGNLTLKNIIIPTKDKGKFSNLIFCGFSDSLIDPQAGDLALDHRRLGKVIYTVCTGGYEYSEPEVEEKIANKQLKTIIENLESDKACNVAEMLLELRRSRRDRSEYAGLVPMISLAESMKGYQENGVIDSEKSWYIFKKGGNGL